MKELVFMEKEEIEALYKELAALKLQMAGLSEKLDKVHGNYVSPAYVGELEHRISVIEKDATDQRTVNTAVVENFKRHDKVNEAAEKRFGYLENECRICRESLGRLGQRMTALEGSNLDDKVRESIKRILRV